jgi:alpha-beta hydrolase superfamily lysophospholipase
VKSTKKYTWVKIVLVVYAVIGSALYLLQDKLLLHPVVVTRDSVYSFNQIYKEQFIAIDENTEINLIQFAAKDSIPKGVVLYFHGNRTNISRYAPFAKNFTSNGFEVWMIDYPGFGKSTGKFTEAMVYEAALQLYKLARTKYSPQQIIIYGKSLGTGIASQLASIRDAKDLILETPYYGLADLVKTICWMYPVDQMIHYHFPTYTYLPKVTAPITIFHGTDDGVIPLSNAKKLQPLLKPIDHFIEIDKGSHNNLNDFKMMQDSLSSILKKQ